MNIALPLEEIAGDKSIEGVFSETIPYKATERMATIRLEITQ